MSLTPSQVTALRAACFADPSAAAFFVAPGNSAGLRAYLNGNHASNVWRTDAPVKNILDAIDWTKYTPATQLDDGALLLALTASQRTTQLLAIQTKQINLQIMIQGRDFLDCSKVTVRAGLRDAVVAVPSGSGGSNMSPGGNSGATVMTACVRPGLRAEVMLAAATVGSDTTGTVTARVMTFEGQVAEGEATGLIYKDNGDLWTAGG